MILRKNWKTALTAFSIILFLLMLETFFFRGIINPDKLLGDSGDGRLNTLLVEHWYKFFSGREPLRNLLAFYPVQNTLSYSDMLLGFAVPFSFFRFIGINMFLANKFAIILIHSIGSFSLYYLLHRKFRLNMMVSLVGTIICAYGNSFSVKSVHTQMITFSLVPLLLIFIYGFIENLQANPRKRMTYGILAILQFELLLYTGFYTAYFFVLYMLTFLIVFIFILWRRMARPFSAIVLYAKYLWLESIFYILLAIILTIPFLMIYIPTSHLFGPRIWDDVLFFLPRITDLVNVSPYNHFYGGIFGQLNINSLEQCTGFPFITALTFIICYISIKNRNRLKIRKSRQFDPANTNQNNKLQRTFDYPNLVIYAMMTAVLISFILIVRDDKISFWWFIYQYIPGASALRAISRYTMFLTLPVAISTAFVLQYSLEKFRSKQFTKTLFILAFSCFLLLENSISASFTSGWKISETQRFLASVSAPPADCEVMFVIEELANAGRADFYNYQLDAWQIADQYNLKTINGYSGQLPPGWDLWAVNQPEYMLHISQWISEYDLKNVYSYNLAANEWKPYLDVTVVAN